MKGNLHYQFLGFLCVSIGFLILIKIYIFKIDSVYRSFKNIKEEVRNLEFQNIHAQKRTR